jgi:hypothetical protein
MADYSQLVKKYGKQYGVSPTLVMKVTQAESSGNPNAVSPKGAQGLMQLMPPTSVQLGVTDPFDPEQNIEAGTRYLAQLLKQFPDQRSAVAAYNFGPSNLAKGMAWPKETKAYVAKVLGPLSARIHGQSYQVGDVVRGSGRHAGKRVADIDEATGLPILMQVSKVRRLVSDQEFQRRPFAERVAALQKIGAEPAFIQGYQALPENREVTAAQVKADPDFARFGPDAQVRILRRLVGDEAADQHPASVVGRLIRRPTP